MVKFKKIKLDFIEFKITTIDCYYQFYSRKKKLNHKFLEKDEKYSPRMMSGVKKISKKIICVKHFYWIIFIKHHNEDY